MIGDRLGKWVIFKELGRGGMGRVYLAQEELTGRKAALKVLAAELAREVGFLQRFQREIEVLSKLQHPNIVQFYEAGCENGVYFFAMEYIEGNNLEQIVDAQGRLPWRDVLEIAIQAVPAIRHCHDHGVIHRDLKPSNLLLNSNAQIKLTDFGIAKLFASTHLTATGGIVGTAEFLSPEQAAGKIVGRRSDLYCLGCVLYMLLTGRPPFAGKSYVELLHKHRYGLCDRPQTIVPDLPSEIDDLVCQLLEKDPDKRPRDALVLLRQLESIRSKLDRKSSQTEVDHRDKSTMAENRTDRMSMSDLPGPATLMSRLIRANLQEENLGGPLSRFFHRPSVLVVMLAVCLAILALAFWPMSQDELFRRGETLMASERPYDIQRAWTEYLEPLEARYPDHPYKEKVAAFRSKLDSARASHPSDAERFFHQGESLLQQGHTIAAQHVWSRVIDVFDEVDGEKEWVRRARRALTELEKKTAEKERLKPVRAALERAQDLSAKGHFAAAERILGGIEELYHDDPSAVELLTDVRQARLKCQK